MEVEPDHNEILSMGYGENSMSEQVRPSPPEYKTNVEWGNTIIHTDFYDNRQETESGHALRVRLFRIVLN